MGLAENAMCFYSDRRSLYSQLSDFKSERAAGIHSISQNHGSKHFLTQQYMEVT
jgi:hypothetical protein